MGLGFLLLPSFVFGQAAPKTKPLPPSAFKLIEVKVTGSHYSSEDVTRAAGLQIGQTVRDDDFKGAMRLLGDCGAFTDIGYTFEYSAEGTSLELKLRDTDHLVPVRFENLVWFSNQELRDKVHAQVPLFNGTLPITGRLVDDVSEALQGMIDEKKIPARVDYTRVSPGDGPTEAFDFSVTGPRISIDKVEFSGADPAELPRLEAAARKLQGQDFVLSDLRSQDQKLFLPVYQAEGYLKAALDDPQPKVTQSDRDDVSVDITIPVTPGPQYKLRSIQLLGYQAFPADTLRQAINLKVGEPANSVEIAQDIDSLKKLYGTRGYMDAEIALDSQIDDADHSVRYVLHFKEGDVYKMGDLEILGVDSRTKDKLQNIWTLRQGDTYDSGYAARFVTLALKQVLTRGEWNTDIHETPDSREKNVDVSVRFDLK
jgi:outer membrane protein insertion porin family